MKIPLQGHQRRREVAKKEWIKIGKDYVKGMPVKDIANKYSKTQVHIYWVIKQLNEDGK